MRRKRIFLQRKGTKFVAIYFGIHYALSSSMKNLLFFALLCCVCLKMSAKTIYSNDLRIGVVDVQLCINGYWKTAIEVEKANAIANEFREQLESAAPSEAAELQKKARESIAKARLEMEKVLLSDLNILIEKVAEHHSFDLILDKSLIPTGSKMTFYISDTVPDLTEAVIAEADATRHEKSTLGDVEQIEAPKLRLGIIDIQSCLNQYWRTQVEVDKIKKRTQELTDSIQSLSPKAAEHAKARVGVEVMNLRREMELSLVADLQLNVRQIAEAGKFALVFDASFLPKSQKGLIYSKPRVPDFTEQTITIANSTRKGGEQSEPDPTAFPETAGFGLNVGVVDLAKVRSKGFKGNPGIIESRALSSFKDEEVDLVFDATFISEKQRFVLVRSEKVADLTEVFSPSKD